MNLDSVLQAIQMCIENGEYEHSTGQLIQSDTRGFQ